MSRPTALSGPIRHSFKVHFFLGSSAPLEESLRGEHSPGCNHLFSFITGEMEKVREIIRTLEWSQSSTPPVRSLLRVIHLAPPLPPPPTQPLSSPFCLPPRLQPGVWPQILFMNICSVLNILQPPPWWKGSCPFDLKKLTCRRGDYGRAILEPYGPLQGRCGADGLSKEEDTGQEMTSRIWEKKSDVSGT